MVEVRSFARHDREQLTRLVNAHIATATPGGSIPSATLLSQLEHPLGEHIIGPWVTDLATFVAVQRDRIVGAAHLRRYADDQRASDGYRNTGELVWLLCWPEHLDAGRAVRDAALAHLSRWGVRVYYGDGSLPAPGVYGVSDSWPHVRVLYEEAGFDPSGGQVEIVYAGTIDSLAVPGRPPVRGVTVQRRLGAPSAPRSLPSSTARSSVRTRSTTTSHGVAPIWPSRGGPTSATTGCGRICEARGSGAGSSVTPEHGCDWAAPLACSPTPSRTSTSTAARATTRAAGSCPSTARCGGWRRDAPPDRHQGDQAPRRS